MSNAKAQPNLLAAAKKRPLLVVAATTLLLALGALVYTRGNVPYFTNSVTGSNNVKVDPAFAATTYALGDHIDMTSYTSARNGLFGVTLVKTQTDPSFNIFVLNDDNDYVSKEVRGNKNWSPELTSLIAKRMKTKCKQGGVFLDVGSNLGWFSLFASAMGCQVHAFEMQPMVRDLFRLSYTINPQKNGKINIVHAAIGKESGKEVHVKYFLGTSDLGSAGLSDQLSKEFKDKTVIAEKMITTSLDDYIDKNGIGKIGYVKMDVEGYEWEALEGFTRTLKRKDIHDIVIEVRKYNFDRVIDLFSSLGYTGYDLDPAVGASVVTTTEGRQKLHARRTGEVSYTDILFTVEKTPPQL
jgi:FkbM family methyltransferase